MCAKSLQCKHIDYPNYIIWIIYDVSDSLFGNGDPLSFVDSNLLVGFTKPSEVRTESAPKISNLIPPIGFKDWKSSRQMTSSRLCKYDTRSAHRHHSKAPSWWGVPYGIYGPRGEALLPDTAVSLASCCISNSTSPLKTTSCNISVFQAW